ncbi:sigma 54-interacting transcriptional regulator [Flagellimonas sp.]|uniref:sigma 54-interacting transcriptional regulator n=1 Tax=Flagellimonas sp. TaxID=2058762 RepID=UPI003F49C255
MANTDINELVDFLKRVSFFSEVDKASLAQLCQDAQIENFGKRDCIIEKGDIGDGMYVILQGTVKVHDQNHVYGTLSPTDCFGEYALIDEEPRSASVTALEETSLLKIRPEDFVNLIASDRGFTKGVLSVLIKRHRELDIIQERLSVSKKEIELSNSKMSGLIDGAMDAIIMFDSAFKIVLTNASANGILENDDVIQRNLLFFLDETSASMLESLVQSYLQGEDKGMDTYLPSAVKVIGSDETETLNEGTISTYGRGEERFFTLILRNIEDKVLAERKISSLTSQTQYLQEEIKQLTHNYGIIAQDPIMVKVLDLVEQVAATEATVLIQGETGTGKELVARAIHNASTRNDKPLIRINCGAIPANLIESELFGHEKGAFTGATVSRKGRFLLADGGTIFLDEIGEMPLDLQPKLLRVIQEGEFDPVGSSDTIKVDVRIIAATHRNLLEFSKTGKFREDLYYRLNVFPIVVPALRDRGDDVHLIANNMVEQLANKMNKDIEPLNDEDKKLFKDYNWPGNVRELQNLIERALIVSRQGRVNWQAIIPNTSLKETNQKAADSIRILTSEELVTLEKENILKALRHTNWKISGENGAAALLQMKPTTLTSKIKALGIVRPV